MLAWVVTRNEQPLECIELPDPVPAGAEVVLDVTRCGVFHSDLHFWHGSYNLGSGKVMTLKDRGVTLPRAPGHEITGRVVAVGPDARDVAIGDERIVYPWIGCGACAQCRAGQDNLCLKQRSLGVLENGGFGSRVKVPHPRYLVAYDGIDPSLAATYACSGISVYSAIGKLMPLDPDDAVLLIGAGGLGLVGIAMLKALGHRRIVSLDISAAKRLAAKQAGATATVDGTVDSPGDDVAARVLEAAGGPVRGAIDFVNSTETSRIGVDALAKGGRLVLVGVAGGELTLSLAVMIFRAQSILGSNTGTVDDLRAVVALAQSGKLAATPVREFAKDAANEALMALQDGRVTGRAVLVS